ncbi:OmcA/MtrC family decaheme c-type cytochrome [Shewanella xiamenensis]|uniref:OmcA/MtrC family decaheme c-type cytochrome n=1 Tax=Shewanella xiamenensis TaxID=332186 RepID=UPI0024A72191|nr:OmcA/MtrC family decaheme c-type cytochrome [Shewanella xiamenensis]MDI5836817.1 OmcA/MtrC family decaheme c-type cytochrome [Shewanella xiamenensis]MDI5841066.1 OmcA/MtrC family decaheme c-type cytochrome [Shewanella xiamenensis]MDI5843678.1 OmcA/MtrC family decaheme c-type cytochrome [Shewanella xiamenensis]MDI5848633.1 OmcA/MtrC family decaheme c-type cytochrome [Shewanella xiamenensis]MDI5851759.1 OmcA/MtrC family decaheme c-type cytochrome [Shewanella xiamenensis]
MMKRFNFNHATKAMLGAGLLSFVLAGCGSDGDDGKPGADGQPGVIGVSIDSTPTLKAKITDATIDAGKVTVNFTLENANGVAVLGLNKTHDLRFGIAQLTPVKEKVGETEADRGLQWQAYINTKKEPGTIPEGVTNLNPSAQFQANVEAANKCDTCLVDNGDGSYSYTYQVNIANVTAPVAVTYKADNTQRATLELQLPQVVANAHLDWQPSTGKTEGIASRNVVSIETCYTCHQPDSLQLHGGRRLDIENCASCHTATSGDPESGNSVDFTYMIHAIHKGKSRESFDAEGNTTPAPYKIIGYGGKVIDYGKVEFPQKPAADCSACHVEGANAPADAALFKADLSNTACIACHTEAPSQSHIQYNSGTNCVSCHNSTAPASGTGSAAKRHGDVMKAYNDAEAMSVKFSDIASDTVGTLTTKVQMLDAAGTPLDQALIDTASYVFLSWDSDKDFTGYQRLPISKGIFDPSSKSYTFTFTGLPTATEPATEKTFELWSAAKVCFNNGGYGGIEVIPTDCSTEKVRKVEIKEAPFHFVWNGKSTVENKAPGVRRDIIDAGKCQGCHNQVVRHYDNGINCGVCHTPTKRKSNAVGQPIVSSSFAWKAHEREGHYLKYAGVQSGTVLKSDCATCHIEKSGTVTGITLGRAPERVWIYGDLSNNSQTAIYVSSDAGTCLSCHQKYLSASAKSHIVNNGGVLDGASTEDVLATLKATGGESCATCHTPAQLMEAHGN